MERLFPSLDSASTHSSTSLLTSIRKKSVVVLVLILIGFSRGFFAIPAGLSLIIYEDRYGWTGIEKAVQPLGNGSSVFLVDRATEFAWITSRLITARRFRGLGMLYRSAVSNLYTQSMNSRTDFFVLDQFTLARWPTLDIMLYSPISVEEYIILDGTVLGNLASVNFTGTVSTLRLVAQIKSGGGIPFVRVFEFTKSRFVRL